MTKPLDDATEDSSKVKIASVVIPLSQDKAQRSLFSLTKVVRLGKSQTAVSFTIEDLSSLRATLEDASSPKHVLLQSMRRLQCYRLCMEDLRVSGLGGIVRVLSMVHPKGEIRETAGRLMGRWKRMALRELFPLPRQRQARRGGADGGAHGGAEDAAHEGHYQQQQQQEEEEEETFGYDVEAARRAPEGSEIAPEELIRMEEEDALYEKMLAKRARVEEDPFCSSSSGSEDETDGDSDMWSPGMDRKRRARAQAASRRQASKKQGEGKPAGVLDADGTSHEKIAGEERPLAKKRLSKAFLNLFAGGKKERVAEATEEERPSVDLTSATPQK